MSKELSNREIAERIIKAHQEKKLTWSYAGWSGNRPRFECEVGEYRVALFKGAEFLFTEPWALEISL